MLIRYGYGGNGKTFRFQSTERVGAGNSVEFKYGDGDGYCKKIIF